eukprot:CAMPEP_0194222380 /NCGR_PEP_ID=MMETSP0156-20130528/32812_1 /TAXON_ID=33649 /ORGANISM="Thalassionema nitzschioides, Strain L26-B" /LENGTH=388 /DNA_ID=CAMNT_0038953147 /DNA_START=12 /DNA_END=1175 /DNA_ORIENTATION=-
MPLSLFNACASVAILSLCNAFVLHDSPRIMHKLRLLASPQSSNDDDAAELQAQANELREKIREMEEALGDSRVNRNYEYQPVEPSVYDEDEDISLKGKTVLVAGANGRLGSMVCRYLLRNYPQTKVVAAVHYIGENSPTSRGYGRLSYEVGAEDGAGSIGAAWSAEDRTASFQYVDEMKDYNLQNLRVIDVEFLDPVQCSTVVDGVDSVVWCATDFNGNQPRAVSGLNFAFLFRAVTVPDKGRVEVEGLRNILGTLKNAKQSKGWSDDNGLQPIAGRTTITESKGKTEPINVVLVSVAPDIFEDFETPFGTFKDQKRQGEDLLKNEFPSLSFTILQMGQYSDNFVDENLEILMKEKESRPDGDITKDRRKINRRDAAKAVVEALENKE